MIYEGLVTNYMDDFIIPGKTENKLEERTIKFLKIVERNTTCVSYEPNANLTLQRSQYLE